MDFCGFSFNGYHSSELGFIRVSDGDRYNDNLGPEFQDKTVQIPGGDGTYFFESLDTKKPFTINIAFDNMSEAQLRTLRQVFNGKDVGPLIFDECPYKAYIVKLQSPVQLKYICFDKSELITVRIAQNEDYYYTGEGKLQRHFKPGYNYYAIERPNETSLDFRYVPAPSEPVDDESYYIQVENESSLFHNHDLDVHNRTIKPLHTFYKKYRIYKGEGTIQFVAYKPYAQAIHKYLDDFCGSNDTVLGPIQGKIAFDNLEEWAESSKMLKNSEAYGEIFSGVVEPNNSFPNWIIYNPGDISMGFTLCINKDTIIQYPIFTIRQVIVPKTSAEGSIESVLNLNFSDLISRLNNDSASLIYINTDTELIEGYLDENSTGTLYNDAIVSGELFKIPPTTSSSSRWGSMIQIINNTPSAGVGDTINIAEAKRHYLYY